MPRARETANHCSTSSAGVASGLAHRGRRPVRTGDRATGVGATHDTTSGALHLARAHGLTNHFTVRANLCGALLRIVTIQVAVVPAQHAAGWHVRTFQPTTRAA